MKTSPLTSELISTLPIGLHVDAYEYMTDAERISQIYPCEAHVEFYENRTPQNSFSKFFMLLKHDSLVLTMTYRPFSKTWDMECENLTNLKSIKNTRISEMRKELAAEKPNAMGKISKNKILNWISFLEKLYSKAEAFNSARLSDKLTYLSKIQKLPVQWRGHHSPETVKAKIMNGDSVIGNIYRGGLRMEVEFEQEFVSTQITTDSMPKDMHKMDFFAAITDNKIYKDAMKKKKEDMAKERLNRLPYNPLNENEFE